MRPIAAAEVAVDVQISVCLLDTGLCSYCVTGVDSSCEKHLTVEFYTVVTLLTFIFIIINIPSPLTPSF